MEVASYATGLCIDLDTPNENFHKSIDCKCCNPSHAGACFVNKIKQHYIGSRYI